MKVFFKVPLPIAASYTDLIFMSDMVKYWMVQPKLAFQCLQSCYRHLWYLTPQLVIFALCDKDTDIGEKEEMAKKLFSIPRPEKINLGKPTFPQVLFGADGTTPKLSTFVTEKSWLLFDLLELKDSQEWLQTPPTMWEMFSDYRKLMEYLVNVSVVNDLVERGMQLSTEFVSRFEGKGE